MALPEPHALGLAVNSLSSSQLDENSQLDQQVAEDQEALDATFLGDLDCLFGGGADDAAAAAAEVPEAGDDLPAAPEGLSISTTDGPLDDEDDSAQPPPEPSAFFALGKGRQHSLESPERPATESQDSQPAPRDYAREPLLKPLMVPRVPVKRKAKLTLVLPGRAAAAAAGAPAPKRPRV